MSLYNLGKKIAGAGATILASITQDGLMSKEDKAIVDAASEPVSYTPTFTASSGTFTTISGSAKYIKIGKQVTVMFLITMTTVGTATGSILMTLPFTSNSNTAGAGRDTNGVGCTTYTVIGGTTLSVVKYDATSMILNGRTIRGSLTYSVA